MHALHIINIGPAYYESNHNITIFTNPILP